MMKFNLVSTYNLLFDCMHIHGILGFKCYQNRIYLILHVISIALIVLGNIQMLISFGVALRKCSHFSCMKGLVAQIIGRVTILGVFCTSYWKRNELAALTSNIKKQMNHLRKRTRKIAMAVNVIFIGNLLLRIHTLISNGIALWQDPVTTENLFGRFTFLQSGENVPRTFKVIFVCLFHFFTRAYIYHCILLLCLFHSSWSLFLSQRIKECDCLLTNLRHSSSTNRFVVDFIKHYEIINALVTHTESALSMQMFCLTTNYFFYVFLLFSKYLGSYSYSPTAILKSSASNVVHAASYFGIIYFASRVHQQDSRLKERVENIAFQLQLSKVSKTDGYILKEFICSRRPLIFTACGMFNFTKDFLLASTGILITYNLLFLQLDMYSHN